MKFGGFVMLTVSIAVAVLTLTSVLVPAVSMAVDTEDTFTNAGVYFMTDDDSSYTLEYKGIDGDIIVNDEIVCNRSDLPGSAYTLISTPEYMVRLQNFSAQSFNLWVFGMDGYNRVVGNNTTESTVINVNDGTIEVVDTNSFEYTGEFRGIAKTGSYVMTGGDPFIVSDTDSIIVGNGTTAVAHWYDLFYMIGTVEDMEVTANESFTISNVSVNSAPLTNYVGGSKVTSITFDVTADEETTVHATYNRVIVPYQVTLEKAIHANSATITLFEIIPIFMVLAILLGIVAVLYVKYRK